jgi:hypothetical protein
MFNCRLGLRGFNPGRGFMGSWRREEKRRENLKDVLDSESAGGIDRDNEGTFKFVACSTEGGECFSS